MRTDMGLQVKVKSPAKVNLTFDVTGDLPDGYHSIVSLFHAVTIEDVLSVQILASQSNQMEMAITAELVGHPGTLPLDENNLIARAARAFHSKTGLLSKHLVQVDVSKQIPIGAGLAGGSSNCAAMLAALNQIFSFPLKEREMLELAVCLGADVPFLLAGGTQLGKNKGEVLTNIPVAERLTFVVLKPRQLAISTPSVFSAYDNWIASKGTDWKPIIDHAHAAESLTKGDIEGATGKFANVFEPIVFEMHPSLAAMKQRLLDLGSWHAQLSGSGPSIFAVVANLEMAHMIRRKFKEDETRNDSQWSKEGWQVDCFIAESAGRGVHVEPEICG